MSGRSRNLSRCPICSHALTDGDVRCGQCGSELIEEANFVDVADRVRYREALASERAAWAAFDGVLRARLQEFGPGWRRISDWKRIWEQVRDAAARANFDELAAQGRAGDLWAEMESAATGQTEEPEPPEPDVSGEGGEDEGPEATRPLGANLERIRQWVAELPDGEVDVVAWAALVKTLDRPFDVSVLEAFRDQQLDRQFSSFETAQVNASGALTGRRQKRVRQFVEDLGGGVGLVMLRIPGGEFRMGSERYAAERPVHTVRVPEFYLGRYPVTQAQWRAVARLPQVAVELGADDSAFEGDDLPVECVSWPEAAEFCARLSRETGRPYRLPSEAEWEYACRAGSNAPFAYGVTVTPAVVNYDGAQPFGGAAAGASPRRTVAAGSLGVANDFGLYDMHGNVWEWCWDPGSGGDAYPAGAAVDPLGDPAASNRRMRGGSYFNGPNRCRSANRDSQPADSTYRDTGARLARTALN